MAYLGTPRSIEVDPITGGVRRAHAQGWGGLGQFARTRASLITRERDDPFADARFMTILRQEQDREREAGRDVPDGPPVPKNGNGGGDLGTAPTPKPPPPPPSDGSRYGRHLRSDHHHRDGGGLRARDRSGGAEQLAGADVADLRHGRRWWRLCSARHRLHDPVAWR